MEKKKQQLMEQVNMYKSIIIAQLLIVPSVYTFPYHPGWPQEIDGGVDVSSPVCVDVNDDDTLEILIAGNTRWVYLFDHHGIPLPGWPKSTSDNPGPQETSSPAVGDIDADSAMEVAYASDSGDLFVWEIDGSNAAGFPVDLGDRVIRASAALEDLNGDGKLEACIGTGYVQYRFFVYCYDGSLLFSNNVEYRVHSTAALGDIDRDNGCEIVHGVDRNVQYGVYAWEAAGSGCTGWPVQTGSHVDGAPALADVDNDTTYEIFVGSIDNRVYGWNYLGQDLVSWPNIVGSGIYEGVVSSPAIGDIDSNGVLDIVVGRGILQSSYGAVFAFSAGGDTLPGFPVNISTGSVTSSPALADVDGDPEIEIIVGCQDGNLYAFNPDGSPVNGFPIPVAVSITSSPAVGDIDLDGYVELAVGGKGNAGSNDSLYMWDLPVVYHASRMPWPMFHHDPQHTGRFPLGTIYPVAEDISRTVKTYRICPTITTGTISSIPRPEMPLKFEVFNALGRKVIDVNSAGLCLNGLSNGVYFIKLSSVDGKVIGRYKILLLKPNNR